MTQYRISIANTGKGTGDALELTERIAETMGLTKKEALRLRLLAEEMLGMVQTIAGDFSADFWIDHEGKDCTLHLKAKSELDYQKRKELLSVSSTGKNTADVGIMGKIRGLFEAGLHGMAEGFAMQADYGMVLPALGALDDGVSGVIYSWSMQKYKEDVHEDTDEWDELEKSIIANIADEVSVGVRNDGAELVVYKSFKNGSNNS